jgi:hypothetical protein
LLLALAALAAAPTRAGASDAVDGIVVDFGEPGTVSRDGTARLPVTVTCSFHEDSTIQQSGSVTVSATQASKSRDASGAGSSEVICDGVVRTYDVIVQSTSGRLRPGTVSAVAYAQASGTFEGELCTEHLEDGQVVVECQTYDGEERLDASDGPENVKVTGSR